MITNKQIEKIMDEYLEWDYDANYGDSLNLYSVRKAIVAAYKLGVGNANND